MKIVFICNSGNIKEIKRLKTSLEQLGHEINLYSSSNFTLILIPFKLRTGDIYFYNRKEIPTLIMRIVQRLLNKPLVDLEKIPGDVYKFEKRCYKEYAKYFKKE